MPGNRPLYEQVMNMGHSAAWDQQWDKAIAAYGRAVQEFPDDPAAHNSLGLALLQARRLEDALKVYTRAHQLAPEDPIPLEKSADVLERLGRMKEAAQQYINVAEVYLSQRDLEKAIDNWERATHLTSGLAHIHQRLAMAYERTGQRQKSINQYLRLAFDFQSAQRTDIATQAVERALRIDPKNANALNTLQALKNGAPLSPDMLEDSEIDQEPKRQRGFEAAPDKGKATGEQVAAEASPLGPLGEAVENALAALAAYVFDTDMSETGILHAVQGIEYQRQGLVSEAVGAYERAIAAHMSHPALHFNLGVLQLELEHWKEAARHLELTTDDPPLAAGAMHGLSQIYNALGNPRAASFHLVQALRLVDIDMAASPEDADQLSEIYDKLTGGIDQADEQQLRNMNRRFLELLTGPEWKQRVTKTRRQLEEAITLQDPESLINIMPYINDHITEGLNLIDAYVRNGLFNLAMDQAHYMLESAPDYLPLHWRIGQILLERDNIQGAINKYNLVAKTYLVRGDKERATEILQEALKVAPMDTSLHQSLIEVLVEMEKWDQVLSQYVDLADAYYQLADTDSARATYQSAIQLAQRIDTPKDQIVHILHRMGDIDISRLDLRQAMRTYEQIRKLDPEDEQARRALVDLYYRLNDPISAIRELDELLRVYAKQHRANRIIQVLEEEVTRYPGDMALRSRLAAVYRQTGSVPKAVEQLDSLAELQLESGLHGDALVTIRRIISMNPDRLEDYQRLLQQLSG
ncbi:tetratricopeptide repeat protein [Aggregatilinea lenta]|uniref:tetratricopeptide repeat protein n=1 Tax=Aggregatilinea lenta TaxID=913108 RepID=UPI000E5B7402|nr:tetratricopeptide repeat protein [Aggregatilinea lenta]